MPQSVVTLSLEVSPTPRSETQIPLPQPAKPSSYCGLTPIPRVVLIKRWDRSKASDRTLDSLLRGAIDFLSFTTVIHSDTFFLTAASPRNRAFQTKMLRLNLLLLIATVLALCLVELGHAVSCLLLQAYPLVDFNVSEPS